MHQDHPPEKKNSEKRERAVIIPERATENTEKLEALIGAPSSGAHDSKDAGTAAKAAPPKKK